MNCKTGAEHLASLRDGRAVYIDGELVADVTAHPAFRNACRSAALLYDFQARPENLELMTFRPDGYDRHINRGWQMPRDYDTLVRRRKALQAWAALSCGFFGRSPDHLSSSFVGQRMGLEVFQRHGAARAKAVADYFDYASRSDLYVSYVIINPQAERTKDWSQQSEDLVARIVDEDAAGITIRGAKMLGTAAVVANEILVANMQPLKSGEEDIAFSCALPMNAKGMRVLSRKSYEAHAVSVFDNPLSSRFDENDALIYFDDVKVPWERVFVHRDPDMCRAQFHDTPAHVYQNYQAQIRLSVKLAFLAGLARRVTEAIGTTKIPAVAEQLGTLAAQVGMVNAMLSGMEASGTQAGEWYVPNKHYMYSAQVITQDLYPRVVQAVRDLAGGALIMLPSSALDFGNADTASVIGKTQRSADHGPRAEGEVSQGGVGRDRLGIRLASPAVRDVLRGCPFRHRRSQLPHLRLARGSGTRRRSVIVVHSGRQPGRHAGVGGSVWFGRT